MSKRGTPLPYHAFCAPVSRGLVVIVGRSGAHRRPREHREMIPYLPVMVRGAMARRHARKVGVVDSRIADLLTCFMCASARNVV